MCINFNNPIYQVVTNWITTARRNHVSWDEISRGYGATTLQEFLDNKQTNDFWPRLTDHEWADVVSTLQDREQAEQTLLRGRKTGIISTGQVNNDFYVPTGEGSEWQCYKNKLLNEKHYDPDHVQVLEDSCLQTLKNLSLQTEVDSPRKGLVVGNVQSGKTGHMAGLIAMAADWGWNTFIIFSGSIESLRQQNERRLIEDLNNGADFSWYNLPKPDNRGITVTGLNLQDLHLNEDSSRRYLTVCLKNATRLRNLLSWIHSDYNKRANLKILVIDDEADQASINTNIEGARTAINNSLINLVNAKDNNGDTTSGYKCMNFVSYTATPYANILNESSPESLYPKDFIATLETSKQYFGPQQIFGSPDGAYDGMDIIRYITQDDSNLVNNDIHSGDINEIPESLKDALCWFIVGTAFMRHNGFRKPISMLIHTSMNTAHHENMAAAIQQWFTNNAADIVSRCEAIGRRETERFTKTAFMEQYPDYKGEVNDYPNLNEILHNEVEEIINLGLNTIRLDDANNPTYHRGLHLCIDNSRTEGDADEQLRLLYPENDLGYAPAFIVIGGNTLSRGLTIEGLISTYFLRAVNQADTLMQMGRWFGYREGYELIPRIWMPQPIKRLFEYLSNMDFNLREKILHMEKMGQTPSQYAISLETFPGRFRITGRNRDQAAEPALMDFSGLLQQTFIFDENIEPLQHNMDLTRRFLADLGAPSQYNSYSGTNIIWKQVSINTVLEYLRGYRFCDAMKWYSEIDYLTSWLETMTNNGTLGDWNVILVGKQDINGRSREFVLDDTHSINMISRSRKKHVQEGLINIGVLTNPRDFIADLDMDTESTEVRNMIAQNEDTRIIRSKSSLGDCPQLLIYVIDMDSQPSKNTRDPLNAPMDIVGLAINIPGQRQGRNRVTAVQIHLDNTDIYN